MVGALPPWIPVPKGIARQFPKGQPFTWIEAYVSVALDFHNGELVTVSGYSQLWGWSRGKVERFLEEIEVIIKYPRDSKSVQKQRGKLEIRRAENGQKKGRKGDKFEQIILIDFEWLGVEANSNTENSEQKAGRRRCTTNNKDKNKEKISLKTLQFSDHRLFSDWFLYAFNVVQGYPYSFEGGRDGKLLTEMLKQLTCKELVAKACHFLTDDKRFPKERAPSISFLKLKVNDYPNHINGKADQFRQIGIIPPDGVLLEDWRPWLNG